MNALSGEVILISVSTYSPSWRNFLLLQADSRTMRTAKIKPRKPWDAYGEHKPLKTAVMYRLFLMQVTKVMKRRFWAKRNAFVFQNLCQAPHSRQRPRRFCRPRLDGDGAAGWSAKSATCADKSRTFFDKSPSRKNKSWTCQPSAGVWLM